MLSLYNGLESSTCKILLQYFSSKFLIWCLSSQHNPPHPTSVMPSYLLPGFRWCHASTHWVLMTLNLTDAVQFRFAPGVFQSVMKGKTQITFLNSITCSYTPLDFLHKRELHMWKTQFNYINKTGVIFSAFIDRFMVFWWLLCVFHDTWHERLISSMISTALMGPVWEIWHVYLQGMYISMFISLLTLYQ